MSNATNSKPSNLPTHAVYQVRDREGKSGIWTRVGSAWSHSDGQGYSVQLDAVPLDGRISLRLITEKQD